MASTPKPVIWMGDSLGVLREFPAPVQDEVGYVLHAFQKKSTKGIATPRRELALVKARLKLAEDLHRKRETK